jgi:excisionase family DNA binding protein
MGTALTVRAAAKALGCSTTTVRRHIAAGRIEAYKVGDGTSRIRIPERSVTELLGASRVRPAAWRTSGTREVFVDQDGDIFAVSAIAC